MNSTLISESTTDSRLIILRANKNDMGELVDVYCGSVIRAKSAQGFARAYHEDRIRTDLSDAFKNNAVTISKAVKNGKIKGFMVDEVSVNKKNATITHVYTSTARKGIGRQLFDYRVGSWRDNGIKKVTVISREDAATFYSALGFKFVSGFTMAQHL